MMMGRERLSKCGGRSVASLASSVVARRRYAHPLSILDDRQGCAPQKLDSVRPELVTRVLAGCGMIAA
jgi:hypothetical protein